MCGGAGPFIESLHEVGIPVVRLRHLTVPIRPLGDVMALREIRQALRDARPDLVAVHSSKAGILGRVAARSLGLPAVLTVHGWSFTPGIPRLEASVYRVIERLAAPLADKIITVSEFDRQLAAGRIAPADRIVTVYNGIPDVPEALRADPSGTPPRLSMVARFGAQKDHPTLFRALVGLLDLPWELDLVGEGPLTGEMQAMAASLGLSQRIRFLGQRMDVDRLLSEAQISLLISNWEGFPLSILEAMRARLPVVASAVGGNTESVRDGETGLVIPRGDGEGLRERLGRLLGSPELRSRMGLAGRARFEDAFSLERSVERTLTVYQEVVRSREPQALKEA